MRNVPPVLVLLLFLGACGQSAASHRADSGTTYQSNSGTVSSLNAVTGDLQPGGSFVSPDSMGSGCYYGGCPAWQFSNFHLSYTLPNGTNANFTNFSGTANFTDQLNVQTSGTASGNDSTGAAVQVNVSWAWKAVCRSGRDGGCTKQYTSGTLVVAK
jgi:hypothetical protein